jgi:N12 class adenine-specific DNA methylase
VPISKTFASYFTAGPTTFPDNSLQDEEDLPVTPASKLPEFQTKIPDVETLPQPDVGGKKVSADFASYFKPALSPTPLAAAPQQPLQPEPDVSPAAAAAPAAPPQQEQPLQPATSGFPITPEMARREGERAKAEDPFNVGVSAVLNFAGNVLKGAGTAAKKQTEKLESENKPSDYWDLQLLQKGIKSGQGLVDYSKEILPDEARIRSLGDKIKRIDESAPGIATSFKMGDVAGAIDGAYFDVALSGSEKANAEMRRIKAQYDQMSAKKEIESELQGRNWFMKTVDATAQMLALMGKSIVMSKIPVIGQTLSTSMWARQGAGEMLARFDKENIPRDVGIPVATIAGVVYAMVEQVQLGQLTNIGARKNLGQALWNRVENLTKEKSVDWVKENFEEVAQGLIEEAAYDIAAGLSGKQKEKVDEIAKRYVSMVVETLKQTAGPMGLLTLLGFGAGAANIALNRKTAEQQPGAEAAATTTAPLPPPPVPAAAAPAAPGPEQAATMPLPPVEQPAPEAAGPQEQAPLAFVEKLIKTPERTKKALNFVLDKMGVKSVEEFSALDEQDQANRFKIADKIATSGTGEAKIATDGIIEFNRILDLFDNGKPKEEGVPQYVGKSILFKGSPKKYKGKDATKLFDGKIVHVSADGARAIVDRNGQRWTVPVERITDIEGLDKVPDRLASPTPVKAEPAEPQPPATPEPQPAAAPTAEPQPPEPQPKPVKTVSPEFQKALSAPAAVPPASEPKPSNQVRNKKELEQWEQLRAQTPEENGKMLASAGIRTDEFYRLDPQKQQEIFDKLTDDEQEQVLEFEPPAVTTIEEIRNRVNEVDRDEEEKKEISNVELQPSEGQKTAGNYRKGHVQKGPFDVSIENPAGSERTGVDRSGKRWSQEINHDYGYIRGTKGADAFRTKDGTDQLDVFIKPDSDVMARPVYVINQVDPQTQRFDEHKVMMGFDSVEEARIAYLSNYEPNWKGLGSIHKMPMKKFEQWAYSEETKYPYKPGKKEAAAAEEIAPKKSDEEKGRALAAQIPGVTFLQSGGGTMRKGAVETEPLLHFNDEVSGSTRTIKPTEGLEELKKTIAEARKGVQTHGKENIAGVPGKKRKGKEPIVAGSDLGAGEKTAAAGGVLQTQKEVAPSPAHQKPSKAELAKKISSYLQKLHDDYYDQAKPEETEEHREKRNARREDESKELASNLVDAIEERNYDKLARMIEVNKANWIGFTAYTGESLPPTTSKALDFIKEYLNRQESKEIKVERSAYKKTETRPARKENEAIRPGTPAEPSPAGPPAAPEKKELTLKERARKRFEEKQAARKNKEPTAEEKIALEKEKRDEALRRASDALRRLGESFGNRDPNTLYSIGTQQADIAFEAVSALVEAGYHEFRAMSIKISELAKEYIGIKGFRDAIEDAYDAYAEEDATVEKRAVSIDEILKQEEKTGILEEKGKEQTDELAKTPPTKLVAKPPENVPPAGERGEADLNAAPGGGGNGEPHRRTGGKRGHPGGSAGKGPEAVPSPIRKRRPGTRGTEPGPNSTVNGGRTDQRLNYHIVNEDNIGKGGPKEKVRNNLAALKTLLKIESENRRATPEEQQILVKYVGWGAFPKVFDAKNHEGWDAEYDELKALLSASDYDAAETSTVNAHYTSPEIVRGMWEAMRWMGFTGGPVFEPGCGIGHFFGLMPQDINATYTGIEMDSLSARIAQQLYQSSNIHEKPFENYSLAENRYTIAIGNVPFSNKIFPYDKESKRYGLEPRRYALHDFFILKTLYGLKPGGVAAFITSRYTMDKTDTEVRRKIAESADFIGAIRLPGKAFKDNAGTDVVTDIVFLRKRAPGVRMSYLTMGFIKTEEREFDRVKGEGKKIEHINRFLNMHPELILGTEDLSGTMYTSDQYNVVLPIEQLPDKLSAAIKLFSRHGIRVASEEKTEIEDAMAKALAPNAIPIGGYYLEDGVIFQKTSETEGVPAKLKGQQADRVKGMIPIKSAIRRLLSVQYESDDDGKLTPHFKSLNAAYDAFVNKYGYLHQRANVAAIEDDPDGALLLALENWDRDTKVAAKADIFTKRTLRRAAEIQHAGNALEAMLISQSEKGIIDWNYMARLTGSEIDALRKDLLNQEQVFIDPTVFLRGDEDVYVARDEYLSGNVREKLKDARKAAEKKPSFQQNAAALEKVIPADLAATDIYVRINSPILSEKDLIDFMSDTFDMDPNRIELSHSREMGRFYFDYGGGKNTKIKTTYGTSEINALQIIDALLNSKQISVSKKDVFGKVIIDTEKTDQAKAKADEIVKAFNAWIWKDPDRTQRIVRDYNDLYNAVIDQKIIHPKRAIDPNAQVTFPGCTYTMRPHQADAIWRQIKQKNVLLAHTVGAGKTLEMVCAGMELKRLGLRKKPLYVVPNHLVEQWAIAFRQAYPGARVLVATDKNFKPEQRKEFLNRIATGNWDAVIVKQSNFLRISLDEEAVGRYVKEKIAIYKNALQKAQEHNEDRTKIKDLKARVKNYESRLAKLMDSAKDVGVVSFEQLGVDQLFIDEFDMYKNLEFFSNRKVLGLGSQKGAEKSFDLGMKIDYIQNLGGGVVGGTGTPISNSMAETYHMMRYLQPEILRSLRLDNFDEWANMFAQEVTSWELNNSGSGYKLRTRFSKFSNIPELMHLLRMAWDIQTADMLEKSGILKRGKNLPNVRFHTISAPATKALKSFIGYLSELEKNARKIPGGVLKIIGMGRHAAVDMRLIAPSLPDDPDYKLNMAAEKVAELLERYPTKTGLVFYDLTRPDPTRPFDPHGELKRKIVAKGFDEKSIAFIHDFDTDAKKLLLFDQVNNGRVRVLIGSTEKMGAGTNVQKILKWLIHIDAPWRPRDIEQREGRIIRQGNTNDEVEIYRFVSKGSYDIALWNLLDIKAKVIRQIMSGEDNTTREIEDDSSFANVMMMAIDNPLVKESMELDQEVRRLLAVRKNWQTQSIEARAKLKANPMLAKELREKAAGARRDLAKAGPRPADFSVKVRGVTYDDRKLSGEAIIKEFNKIGKSGLGRDDTDIIGEFAGLPFVLEKRFSESVEGKALYSFEIVLQGENEVYRVNGSSTPHVNGIHLTQIIWDKEDGLEARAKYYDERAMELEKTLDEYRLLAEKPFEDEEKLETTRKRLADVLEQLRKDNAKQAQKAAGEEPDRYNWAGLEKKRQQNVDEESEDSDTPENTTTEVSFDPQPLPEGKDYELAEPDKYYALLRKPDDTISFDLIDKAKPMRNAPFGADIFYYKDENRQFRANEGKSGLSVAGKKNTLSALEDEVVKNLEATGKASFDKLIDEAIRGNRKNAITGLSPRYRIKGEAPNEEEIKFAAGEENVDEAKRRIAVEKIKKDFWDGKIKVTAGWWNSEPHWVFDFDYDEIRNKYGVDDQTAFDTTRDLTTIPETYGDQISFYALYRHELQKELPERGTDVTGDLLDYLKQKRLAVGLPETPEITIPSEENLIEEINYEKQLDAIKKVVGDLKIKAYEYERKAIEENADIAKFKEELHKKYGYKQTVHLSDMDNIFDIGEIYKKQGWTLVQDEKPIESTAAYIGSFHGGEVTERIFEKDGQKRFVYTLPERSEVDSFSLVNTITDKKLYGDEYLELLYKTEGRRTWSDMESEEETTLPGLIKSAREEMGGRSPAPEGFGIFTPYEVISDEIYFRKNASLVDIDENNYVEKKNKFIQTELDWLEASNAKYFSEKRGELDKKLREKKNVWETWFTKKRQALISVAQKIREQLEEVRFAAEENEEPLKPEETSSQIETPEFKKWAENAPVVKLKEIEEYEFETGKPVVAEVLHGSDRVFTEFKKEELGSSTYAQSAKKGFFFTNSPDVAAYYPAYDKSLLHDYMWELLGERPSWVPLPLPEKKDIISVEHQVSSSDENLFDTIINYKSHTGKEAFQIFSKVKISEEDAYEKLMERLKTLKYSKMIHSPKKFDIQEADNKISEITKELKGILREVLPEMDFGGPETFIRQLTTEVTEEKIKKEDRKRAISGPFKVVKNTPHKEALWKELNDKRTLEYEVKPGDKVQIWEPVDSKEYNIDEDTKYELEQEAIAGKPSERHVENYLMDINNQIIGGSVKESRQYTGLGMKNKRIGRTIIIKVDKFEGEQVDRYYVLGKDGESHKFDSREAMEKYIEENGYQDTLYRTNMEYKAALDTSDKKDEFYRLISELKPLVEKSREVRRFFDLYQYSDRKHAGGNQEGETWEGVDYELRPNVQKVFVKLLNPLVHDYSGEGYRDTPYTKLVDEALQDGRDGVIMVNTLDPYKTNIFVVFEPTQIKSATGNRGTFAPENPDVTFAGGESEPTGKSGQFENRYVNPLEERLTTLLFRQAKVTAVPGSVRTVAPPQTGPQADLKRALELATGKEVVLIETDPIVMTKAFGHTVDGFSIPGAVSPEIAGKIFIDVNSGRPVKWTAFHELWHFIENDPELSKRFWDTVTLTDKGKTVLARRGKSEFAADIVGEMMARPDFLQNMAREDEGAFRKIINKLRQILSKLASALRRAFGGAAEKTKLPAKYEAFISNIEEVRNAVAGIYADFKLGAQMESVPQRLAAAMGQAKEEQPLFAKGRPTRLPLLPKTIPLPTPEQIAEAKANATLDEERVKAIENEMAKLRGKLRHLPKEQLRERAEISLKIQGDIAARLWEIRNAIYEYAKKIGLKGVPYNKVDLMMKNADTLAKMKKAMERLDNVWLQYSKSVAVQQVLDLVDVTYRRLKKIEAGKLRSTVPGEYNDRLKEYLDALSSQPDWYKGNDYPELVRKMLNYYNLYAETDIKRAENVSDLPYDIVEWMQDPTKPVPDNMRKMIRELFNRNLVTMSTDQLETVVKDIDSINKVGRTVLEQREAERKEALNLMAIEQAQNIRAASKDIEGDPLDQALGNKRLTRMEWLKKLSEKHAWSFIDPERMVEWLTGWKGFNGLKEAVLKPFYRAEAVKLKNVALANEKFLERHRNVDWRTVLTQTFMTVDMKGIYALAEVKLLPKKYQKEMVKKLTLDNAMFIYANSQNEGNLAHLRGLFINNEVADIFIEEVITKLPQEYRDIVDAQIAYYDNEQYQRVSDVFERDHMIALPKEKWYFPIQNLLTDRSESALVADYLARYSSHWAGVQKGMTKVRVHSKAPFRKMSYFGTVTSNMQQVEHYIAYNDAVREVNRFLHHDAIKSAITNRSEEVYKQLLEWVKAVAYGRVSGSEHVYDKIFDFMRKNFTTYALGLKLTTALMQLTSLPKGMAMINKADVARSCMAYLMDPKAAEKHANELSAMMANREHSYERELAEMFEKQAVREYAGISTLSDKAKRALMWHIGRVDKIIATVLWNAKFDEQMHIHGNETAAAEAADEMIRKTQSRGGVLYMPSIYRGGGLVRAMTIFTSDLNQNINLLFELQGKWKLQPSTKNVHDVFWSFAIPTTMIWMINNAFIPAVSAVKNFIDPDEPEDFRLEEWMKELISQFTGGVAFLGPIFDAAIGMAADSAKELRGIIPDKRWKRFVGDMSPAGVDVIEELVRGFADKNPEALFDAIAIATGYPYRTVRRAVTGAVEVARGGGAKAAAGMIWSRRQLREENIYDSMARRLYKPRPKSDDFERYAKWYKGLDKSEQRAFQKYTREWYKRKMLK